MQVLFLEDRSPPKGMKETERLAVRRERERLAYGISVWQERRERESERERERSNNLHRSERKFGDAMRWFLWDVGWFF